MRRYYFHVTDGNDYTDPDGTVLPDLDAARLEALRFASALLPVAGPAFWKGGDWTMRVADESNVTLFSLTFEVTNAPSAHSVERRRAAQLCGDQSLGQPS